MIDFNYTILIQFANFLIVMILLNHFLFKPVLKAISKREQTISSLVEEASLAKGSGVNFEKLYDERSKEMKRPIIESKDAMLADAHTTSMRMIEKARSELADELSHLKADIERDSKQVYDSLKVEVERLSGEMAQKILKRSV